MFNKSVQLVAVLAFFFKRAVNIAVNAGAVARKSITLLLCCMLSLTACAEVPLQGNIEEGAKKSAVCGMCHGKDGISIVPIYPNIAGQKEQYLVLQLQAFRSGERVNMAMTSHAQKLSDQDIADLAAYYANLPANKS